MPINFILRAFRVYSFVVSLKWLYFPCLRDLPVIDCTAVCICVVISSFQIFRQNYISTVPAADTLISPSLN